MNRAYDAHIRLYYRRKFARFAFAHTADLRIWLATSGIAGPCWVYDSWLYGLLEVEACGWRMVFND